jgi:two-component system, chemotaxis family, chemotaxis protein CheY
MKNTVLSIDDSSTTRKIIKKSLASLGYEFLEATDGANGLEVLNHHYEDVSIILLDWNMPGMNGIEFLEAINAKTIFRTIPIIMVTTEAEKANVVKALKLGVKNYILKPFTDEELILKVKQCLGRN